MTEAEADEERAMEEPLITNPARSNTRTQPTEAALAGITPDVVELGVDNQPLETDLARSNTPPQPSVDITTDENEPGLENRPSIDLARSNIPTQDTETAPAGTTTNEDDTSSENLPPIEDEAGVEPEPLIIDPARNLALYRPTDASSSKSVERASSLVVDGNPHTRWTSAYADRQWIAVDLGAVFKLDRVEIRWEAAHAESYLVQSSNESNPLTWTTMAEERGHEGWVRTRLPLGSEARWVRMYGERRATNYGFSIWEFRVFADLDEPQPPPPPNPMSPQFRAHFRGLQRILFRLPRANDVDHVDIAGLMAMAAGPYPDVVAEQRGEASSGDSITPTPSRVLAEVPHSDGANIHNTDGTLAANMAVVETSTDVVPSLEPIHTGTTDETDAANMVAEETSATIAPPQEYLPKPLEPLSSAYIPPIALNHLLGEIPCSICFELLQGYAITITACGHIFHARCLRYSGTSGCPVCRCRT